MPGYAASKGGVAQLTKSLAIAYAADGIRVNAVAPGWIATPLTGALREDPARNAPILARTPMGRWGEPAEVAAGVVFLASPLASYVTGRGDRHRRRLPRRLSPIRRRRAQLKNWPPLAEMVEPVMKPAASEARKTTQRAISSASPRRPTGIWAMIDSRTFSGTAITISVAI